MRRGYSHDVRAEAITARYQGKQWQEVQDAISRKFHVKPSVRQMQKWLEKHEGFTGDPTGVKYVARVIEDSANLAKPLAQAQMMGQVFPLWASLQETPYNLGAQDAGLVAMWLFFESQVGRQNLERTYSLYKRVRDKLVSGRRRKS